MFLVTCPKNGRRVGNMRLLFIIFIFLFLASCNTSNVFDISSFSDKASTVKDTSVTDYYPDDQLVVEGKLQFKEGNYGKAYTLFKKAINVVPNDPHAWIGYAAASDHLRRFDSSNRAYRRLAKMIGHRPEYHNNVGYSYLLRGNLRQARRHFLKAYEIDPSSEVTANNLELLRNSVSHPKRGLNASKGI